MNELVYSINEQDYDDLEDIMNEIDSDYEPGEITHIYQGIKVPYTHSDFVDGDYITEVISNCAYEDADEYSESYIEDIWSHRNEIKNAILDYLNENIPQPGFFTVKDIKKIPVPEY